MKASVVINPTSWSTRDLVATLAVALAQSSEIIVKAIDDGKSPQGQVLEQAKKILAQGPWAHTHIVRTVCSRYQSDWALAQRASLELGTRLAFAGEALLELHRRVAGQVGRALMSSRHSLKDLFSAFQIERLEDYRDPAKSEDTRQEAAAAALRKLDKMQTETISGMKIQYIPAPGGLGLSGKRWRDWPRWQAALVGEILSFCDVIISGASERLPDSARHRYRWEFEKEQVHRKKLEGTEDFPDKGPESERAYWDFSERAAKGRHKEIQAEIHAQTISPEGYVLDLENFKNRDLLAGRAYRFAKERWGPQGEAFLKALMEGKSITDAADLAKVSRVTGHKYLKELRIVLSPKNPT